MVHVAIKVESHLLKTTFKHTHDDGFYNSFRKDANKISTQISPSNFSKETTSPQKFSTQNPSTPKSPTKTLKTKCFKCLSFEHIAGNCPTKQPPTLNAVKQDQLKIKTKSDNEREKEGQDTMSLIPSLPRCFPSLSFSLLKHSKYLTFLLKKFRDALPTPPKGSHLLRGFFTKHFIPKYSLQTCHVARILTYHLLALNESKSSLPFSSSTVLLDSKLPLLYAGVLNSRSNFLQLAGHDVNPKYMKMIKDANYEGSSH